MKKKDIKPTKDVILEALDKLPEGQCYGYSIATKNDKDVSQIHRALKRMETVGEIESENKMFNGKMYLIYRRKKKKQGVSDGK